MLSAFFSMTRAFSILDTMQVAHGEVRVETVRGGILQKKMLCKDMFSIGKMIEQITW